VSVEPVKLAHVFEDVADGELIEVIGEATRDESTAIAQRLLGVGKLYARRAVELAEWNQWRIDPTDEVAAEISAAPEHQPWPGGGPDPLRARLV
jgi:hypothetical protein